MPTKSSDTPLIIGTSLGIITTVLVLGALYCAHRTCISRRVIKYQDTALEPISSYTHRSIEDEETAPEPISSPLLPVTRPPVVGNAGRPNLHLGNPALGDISQGNESDLAPSMSMSGAAGINVGNDFTLTHAPSQISNVRSRDTFTTSYYHSNNTTSPITLNVHVHSPHQRMSSIL